MFHPWSESYDEFGVFGEGERRGDTGENARLVENAHRATAV